MKKDSKIIMAHCEKTGKKFCIEAEKTNFGYEAVNFIDLDEKNYNKLHSEISGEGLKTSVKILDCEKCGTRQLASCQCLQKSRCCHLEDPYEFECIYCSSLVLDAPKGKQKIYVSSPHFDNIGQVLTSMKLKYEPFKGKYDCDILFLNCGTKDHVDITKIKEFVQNGGCLYASDWANDIIEKAFPGLVQCNRSGSAGTFSATVTDPELMQVMGTDIDIQFDLGAWSIIQKNRGNVLLKISSGSKQYANLPVMIMRKYGTGSVFYTSFHNHAQVSEKETMLLQLLLLKQLSTNASVSLEEMGELIGLNISGIKERFSK